MSMFEQTQLAIESFDLTLVPGSVKKLMAGINAVYEGQAKEEDKIKGAGGSSDLWKVPVNELKVLEGFNVRLPGPDLDEHLDFLTDSILEEGFFQHRPLAALVLEIDGELGLYVFDGHCRLESAKRAIAKGAPIELVPVVVQDGRNVNLDDLYVQMHRLNKGKELSPFELGLLCKRLSRNGHDDTVIAKRMGIGCAVISAPAHVQDYPARYSPQMGFEGANVLWDSWVHPLVMGLEEHLLTMFRDDAEFSDEAGPSHLGEIAQRASDPVEPANDDPAAGPAWDDEAERELRKIPFFVRGRARRNTESYAVSQGADRITVDTLYEAKAHYAR